MLFRTNASVDTEAVTGTEADKEREKAEKRFTWAAPKAATYTNYRVLWVLLGSVAALTVGFCYLFFQVWRIVEIHRRNGERMKDELGTRLHEQDKKR